jgi:serine/threonine-protein kinase
MGEVWLAADEELGGREVAIKTVKPDLLDAEGLALFHQEMRLACRMTHQNIMTVLTSGTEKGMPFMVMERLQGRDLSQPPDGWGGVADIVRAGRETCLALAYAHDKHGVVHRDVKPANLFLCDTGSVKVTDFGVAKILTASRATAPGTMLGTPGYMAPEQWLGQPATFAIDVWATGCVLYELLSGRRAREYASLPEFLAAAVRGERVAPLAAAGEVQP